MSQTFIDDLEAVDIEDQNAEHFSGLPGSFNGTIEKTVEIITGWKGCQGIEQGNMLVGEGFSFGIGQA